MASTSQMDAVVEAFLSLLHASYQAAYRKQCRDGLAPLTTMMGSTDDIGDARTEGAKYYER